MAFEFEGSGNPGQEARGFLTTHWSNIFSASMIGKPEREIALERLCRAYWYPIYSFIRRKGFNAHDAEDLTQGFFARFLEKNYVADADSSKGRFRTFLLNCAQNFLANEWDRKNAQKRGGGVEVISLDAPTAEERFHLEPAHDISPEKAFERQWVEAVLESVLRQLKQELSAAGKEEQFESLKIYLEDRGAVPFEEMAKRLGVTEAAVKGVVRRMRQRYRDLFRQEIERTVADPREVEGEIRHLIEVLAENR
jgi:RNA polymerase sigma-70 factor (ECF subfamily)